MNKYDDTDYLIEREESIEYGKGTDTNVGSIEEDIMSEEAFNELIDNFEVVEILTIYGRKAIKQNVKKLQKRIKELEEENKLLLNSKVGIDLSYDDYIPKQKVINKMEQLNKEIKNGDEIEAIFKIKQQQILQELLEEGEKNELSRWIS